IDGYIDDSSDNRLLLSNDEDLDRVDALRAECDAILVGANTIRRDDPRLMVRSPERHALREAARLPATPTKVTLTRSADLDPAARFFTEGDVEKLVYSATDVVEALLDRLDGAATVVDAADDVPLPWVLSDLAARGVGRLLVEGGSRVHT